MTTDTTINKYIRELMGECYHKFAKSDDYFSICIHCNKTWMYLLDRNNESPFNPDYLHNKSDSRDFLTFCVTEWELFEDFLYHYADTIGYTPRYPIKLSLRFIKDLLKDLPTLPTAVYNWCKEKKDGKDTSL